MKLWEEYIQEKEVKIHAKRKAGMSFAAVAPIDDVLAAGATIKTLRDKNASKMKKAKTLAGVAAGLAAYGGYRLIRSYLDKCTKQCGTYAMNTPKRQLCLYNCKGASLRKEIVLMKKNKEAPEKIAKKNEKLYVVNKRIELYKQYIKDHPSKEKK